jgi:cathepsin C
MSTSAFAYLQSFRQKYKKASDIPDSEIPESFDLRNVQGQNFMGRVRDQDACGSCYTVAFITVIESRLRQQTGRTPDDLSVQHLLSCNYMTEACTVAMHFSGGMPYVSNRYPKPCGVLMK